MVFATLIDFKADSKNHTSHMIITRAERGELIDLLTRRFGKSLDLKGQNYTVSAAGLIKDFLLGRACSDDPWE
jgi:hypothetical protein